MYVCVELHATCRLCRVVELRYMYILLYWIYTRDKAVSILSLRRKVKNVKETRFHDTAPGLRSGPGPGH